MTDLRKAAEMALEALDGIHVGNMTPMAEENWNKATEALRQALAQPDDIQAAVLAEREACAKLCEKAVYWDGHVAASCAAAIKARGET